MPVDQSRQYLRIRDQLAADIAQGVLQVKLPSERELAERFLCTRITLREALASVSACSRRAANWRCTRPR